MPHRRRADHRSDDRPRRRAREPRSPTASRPPSSPRSVGSRRPVTVVWRRDGEKVKSVRVQLDAEGRATLVLDDPHPSAGTHRLRRAHRVRPPRPPPLAASAAIDALRQAARAHRHRRRRGAPACSVPCARPRPRWRAPLLPLGDSLGRDLACSPVPISSFSPTSSAWPRRPAPRTWASALARRTSIAFAQKGGGRQREHQRLRLRARMPPTRPSRACSPSRSRTRGRSKPARRRHGHHALIDRSGSWARRHPHKLQLARQARARRLPVALPRRRARVALEAWATNPMQNYRSASPASPRASRSDPSSPAAAASASTALGSTPSPAAARRASSSASSSSRTPPTPAAGKDCNYRTAAATSDKAESLAEDRAAGRHHHQRRQHRPQVRLPTYRSSNTASKQ